MHILLVEPEYYTRYPPLGLLKIATYHRLKGDSVELVRGCVKPSERPGRIYVTSLFTWAWRPVWQAVRFYKERFPNVEVWLGGLYATLLPWHAGLSGADYVHVGLWDEVEDLMPAYDLVPKWDGSIIFASRGCNRLCPYCAVPKIEGQINRVKYSVKQFLWPTHTRLIFFDNNVLQAPNWRSVFDECIELGRERGIKVDFNQGLDARCITYEAAEKISQMKTLCVRLSWDYLPLKPYVERAIRLLKEHGIRGRKIFVYILYNYWDTPDDLFNRVKDLLNFGVVVFPMRYEPLNALEKGKFVSEKWTKEQLELVEDFRRVYGFGGVFPPYEWLVNHFNKASSFEEAFIEPLRSNGAFRRAHRTYIAGNWYVTDWRKAVDLFLAKRW